MPNIFGWEFNFKRKSSLPTTADNKPTGPLLSPVPPANVDGAVNIQYASGGGYYGYYLDLDGTVIDDFQLINRYREMQVVAEVDEAIDQIINEMVIQDAGRMPVSLDLDYVDETALDEKTKIRIQAEFDSLLKQLNFHKDAYSVVRQWYIDGRLFYYLMVDENATDKGIQEIRLIDPRCIRKVREVTRKRHENTQTDIVEVQREYYMFNPMGFVSPSINTGISTPTGSTLQYNGTRLSADSVANVPSGLYDANKRTVLSWLHKALKPLNLMRMMEDSCVIYRVSRAPERRVFYIDVGNLPKQKAEQYLNEIMQKHRNKLVYDVATGDIRDDRKFMSILEDFWLPRREGGKGTEIQTLPAGQNLSEMEDVDYFRRKLYRALGLPPSRIDQGQGFSIGRASEISRDELRFGKFIHRLQVQFNTLFDQILERQLRLKNVLTEQEWYRIKDNIRYKWQQDSYFEELKAQEMWTSRMNLLGQMDPYINKYFSSKWVQRTILKFTDDEWAAIREEFDNTLGFDGDGLNGEDDSPFGKDTDTKFQFGKDLDDEADEILTSDDKDEDDEGTFPTTKKPERKGGEGKPPAKKPAVKKAAGDDEDEETTDKKPAPKKDAPAKSKPADKKSSKVEDDEADVPKKKSSKDADKNDKPAGKLKSFAKSTEDDKRKDEKKDDKSRGKKTDDEDDDITGGLSDAELAQAVKEFKKKQKADKSEKPGTAKR